MIALDIRLDGLGVTEQLLARLDPLPAGELLDGIARMIQEQTRRRIISDKTAPDGAAWPPNRTGTPILYRSGALARSIDYAVSGFIATIGSGLIYAGIHQSGGDIVPKKARRMVFRAGNKLVFARKVHIPARPYLGLSVQDREDVLDQVGRFISALIGGGR